ncbi:hypothetical protein L226DRAFT_609065 [Lentinus tigrinus ALCF2SS1-7]|uniref:Uncharacterized protein n=1 Tax=Lentinus tigrinus ALCF2SS1-6 TaxID=1328759 RepID=A0A5C2SQP1_9APHY|nr:hypothetical protein L227DRAFT_597464 [Lentinus tigrinus ALCF2SS1-6]RPD80104.1 hypothetical protein L226DRAFT_609065 [Lentinus tigrinus ALCF2SS1-7]
MWRFDPPYPSFTLIMTQPQAQNFDISRLPAYRSSVLERFHPYARKATRRNQDRLMLTIDRRYAAQPIAEEATTAPTPPIVEEEDEGLAAGGQLARGKLAAALAVLLEILRFKFIVN